MRELPLVFFFFPLAFLSTQWSTFSCCSPHGVRDVRPLRDGVSLPMLWYAALPRRKKGETKHESALVVLLAGGGLVVVGGWWWVVVGAFGCWSQELQLTGPGLEASERAHGSRGALGETRDLTPKGACA